MLTVKIRPYRGGFSISTEREGSFINRLFDVADADSFDAFATLLRLITHEFGPKSKSKKISIDVVRSRKR